MQSIAQFIVYMNMTFINSEILQKAYLGKHAHDLLLKSSDQVAEVYKARGILIPVVVSSTMQFLSRRDNASLADISRALGLPHQLVAQRIQKLDRLGLVEKHPDPFDGRRFEYCLTDLGRDQASRLTRCMEDTAVIYNELYDEIGYDLAQLLLDAVQALERKPLITRFAEKYPIQEAG